LNDWLGDRMPTTVTLTSKSSAGKTRWLMANLKQTELRDIERSEDTLG